MNWHKNFYSQQKPTKNSDNLNKCIPAHEKLAITYTRDNQFLLTLASLHKPNKTCKYLIDTGASHNLMRWDIAANMGVNDVNYAEKLNIIGFNSTMSTTLGSVKIIMIMGALNMN